MILNEHAEIELEIGAVMKINHGSPINSYVNSSQEAARDVIDKTIQQNESIWK